ncbi:MAG: amidohydrolase family protein, partial [Kiloniellaceae bacterium]
PHAGGAFPYLVGRLHHGWKVRPECRHLHRGPLEYLRRFTYDTIAHAEEALGHLVRLVGANRVMLGSDYCFDMGCARPVEVVMNHRALGAEEKRQILHDNAARLLRL